MYEQRHGIQIMKNQREHFRKRTCTHPTVRCSVSKMRSDKHNYQRKCVFSGDAWDIMQGSLDCVLWFRQGGRWPNFFNLGEANRFFRSSSYVFRHLFLSSKANIWMFFQLIRGRPRWLIVWIHEDPQRRTRSSTSFHPWSEREHSVFFLYKIVRFFCFALAG